MTPEKSKYSKKATILCVVLALALTAGLAFFVCSLLDEQDSLKVAIEGTAPKVSPAAPNLADERKTVQLVFPGDKNEEPSAGKTTLDVSGSSQLAFEARNLMDDGKYSGAIEKFTACIEESKKEANSRSVKTIRALCYQSRGYCKVMTKDYAGAIPDLTKAIEMTPNYRFNYVNRAEAYRLLGKHKESQADLDMARQLEKTESQ